MNNTAIIVLLVLNMIGTSILGTILVVGQKRPAPSESTQVLTQVDLSPLEEPLIAVSTEVEQLNATVQRFSTSYVQYDFLKRELDHLSVVDQTIGAQTQATAASKNDKNAKEVEEMIGKLGNLSQQVKGQLQTRRQTMLRLISGLEKELADISSTPLPQPETAAPKASASPEPSSSSSSDPSAN
ncbi:hypothetical protein N8528_03755 [Akkermansiaceae bacterium]|nr:hypothetical protein [Akkermansiaceae bacterium]